MSKVLLVKLSDAAVYKDAKVKNAVPHFPSLTLATIAGNIREKNHDVKIFDYSTFPYVEDADKDFLQLLKDFSPDFVGITFPTPLFEEMVRIGTIVKNFNSGITLIGGGPHASAFPEESLKTSPLDIVITGEGDFVAADAIGANNLSEIDGIAFKESGSVVVIPKKIKFLDDLDKLPFPAWDLFDLSKYHTPRQMRKKSPVGWIETSRGCLYGCVYCNKNIFGQNFRYKSARRTVDEMEFMLECGFKEIQIGEDMFTTNKERVMQICAMIKERGLKFPWATTTGIRVDSVSLDMLKAMKNAGCYRVYYGFESGSDQVLVSSRKGTNTATARQAVDWSKEAGLEVLGFFMIGLPGETEETMQQTIDFAKSLNIDFAKMTIMSPLPGTPVFNDFKEKGLLKKDVDWSTFNYYTPPSELYTHPNLDWATIEKYYKKFYREFYFRPGYMAKRLVAGIKNGTLIDDIKAAKTTKW
ncbi:MAG: radical SAM protein [Candidatus Aenigmarchaeota archaeon]|nr:radical SAM protein [Candidatus Aenigmarchaeota archaeon]